MDNLNCLNIACSFCENNTCTYGGLMYERPCNKNDNYFEDEEE